jgi:hypothetical protein
VGDTQSKRVRFGLGWPAAACAALFLLAVGGLGRRPSPESTAKRIVASVLDDLEAERRAYDALAPQLKASLGDPRRLDLQSTVSTHMALMQKAIQVNQALLDKGNSAEGEIATKLHAAGFSDEEVNPLIESLRPTLNWERGRVLHELDRRILSDYRDVLRLLRQEAGQYSTASTVAAFEFKNPAARAEFALLLKDFNEAGMRQNAMVTEHVAALDPGQ